MPRCGSQSERADSTEEIHKKRKRLPSREQDLECHGYGVAREQKRQRDSSSRNTRSQRGSDTQPSERIISIEKQVAPGQVGDLKEWKQDQAGTSIGEAGRDERDDLGERGDAWYRRRWWNGDSRDRVV